jgi:hypothetical protein
MEFSFPSLSTATEDRWQVQRMQRLQGVSIEPVPTKPEPTVADEPAALVMGAFVKEFFSPVLGHKNAHSHKKHCIVAAEWCALIAALKQPNGGMLPPLPGLVSAACSAHLPAPLRRASAACLFAQDHARP